MKKIVSVVITILTVCSMYMLSANAVLVQVLIGDTNQDGKVSIVDATLIQKYLARKIELNKNGLKSADANRDGFVDINDSTHIQGYLVGFSPDEGTEWYVDTTVTVEDETETTEPTTSTELTTAEPTTHTHTWEPVYRTETKEAYDEEVEIPGTSIKYYDFWSECSCGVEWHKVAKCYCKGNSHDYDNNCFYDISRDILDTLYLPHWEEEWDKIYAKLDEMEANGASEDDMIEWLATVDSHARASFCEYDHTGPDTKTIHHEAETVEVLDHYECKECGQTK